MCKDNEKAYKIRVDMYINEVKEAQKVRYFIGCDYARRMTYLIHARDIGRLPTCRYCKSNLNYGKSTQVSDICCVRTNCHALFFLR